MDMKRAVLHSDLNSFYASVEMLLNPSLRGKAVAVCGSTEDRHGIVLAKSDLEIKADVKVCPFSLTNFILSSVIIDNTNIFLQCT